MSANEMRTEKYESTGETRILDGVVLHRIRALRSFGHIERGDIGGWIASVHNLHASGDAWVVGDAQVYGDARVYGNAHYITLGPLGSRRSTLTICADAAIGWRYTTGCFSGSRAELSAAVDSTHPSGCFRGEYEAAIAFADAWIAAHEVRA